MERSTILPNNNNDDASVIRLVHNLLLDGFLRKASDIHFEPYQSCYRVRYRINGLLTTTATPSLSMASRIVARLKVMAELDIAEKRLPQDGRFQFNPEKTSIVHARVSSCPTVSGEKIVIRLLDPQAFKPDIYQLGLNPAQLQHLLNAIRRLQGMILVTGPTGSGKSMTLYSTLQFLNQEQYNICTIEDPVEMLLPGLNQINVHSKTGYTFARTLRALLRQDPDIIMIGEIRDLETVDIAMKAAMTGHLVLSTLHTNSTIETLTRLHNMGVAPMYIAASVTLIIAQRLLRRLCPICKIKTNHTPASDRLLASIGSERVICYQAQGCSACIHGYQGRLGIFELLPMSLAIREQIVTQQSLFKIREQAEHEHMLTLAQSACYWLQQGETTLEEVMRVIAT